jgi:hypothetical protein
MAETGTTETRKKCIDKHCCRLWHSIPHSVIEQGDTKSVGHKKPMKCY